MKTSDFEQIQLCEVDERVGHYFQILSRAVPNCQLSNCCILYYFFFVWFGSVWQVNF